MATDFFRGRLIGASSVLMGIVFNVDGGYLGLKARPFQSHCVIQDLRVSPYGPQFCISSLLGVAFSFREDLISFDGQSHQLFLA